MKNSGFSDRIGTVPQLEIELAWVLDLNGCIFAMLTPDELERFKYFRDHGRKYGVIATVTSSADPAVLAKASSQDQQDEIMRRVNSIVSVIRCEPVSQG